MFARQLNQIRLDVSISPKGPLLIRSGRQGADPTRPQLEAVRTTVDGQPSVYIPGSSLKGVLRSHAERLLTSEGLAITPTFDKEAWKVFNQKTPADEAHRGTCPLGRTFGSLNLKSRTAVTDFLPGGHSPVGSGDRRRQLELANDVEIRNGVAIDRLLGSASGGALFDREAVVQGRFDGRIVLRNAQLYQLALVLLVLRDLDEGFLQLGSSTSRGHGFVTVAWRSLVIESRRGRTPDGQLFGAGALEQAMPRPQHNGEEPRSYELFGGDSIALPSGLASQSKLAWDQVRVPPERIDELAEVLMGERGPWIHFLQEAESKTWAA